MHGHGPMWMHPRLQNANWNKSDGWGPYLDGHVTSRFYDESCHFEQSYSSLMCLRREGHSV